MNDGPGGIRGFPPVEPYVNRKQLAEIMGVSVGKIDNMVREGMPSEVWGKRTRRFRASEALAWAQTPRDTSATGVRTAKEADRLRRPVPRLALNQEEAAEALGMSVDAFESHVKPRVSCVYIGTRRLYPVAALEQWLTDEAVTPRA